MNINERSEMLLSTATPTNFKSKADIYRFLAYQGVGDKEMLKSRYKRNTDEFRAIIDTFLNGSKSMPTEYTSYTAPTIDYEKEMERRFAQYNEYKETKEEELARKHIYIPGNWSCIMHFGDIHSDDEGSNLEFLVKTIKEFQQLGAKFVNLGDNANNWQKAWSLPIALKAKTTPKDAKIAIHYLFKLMGSDQLLVQTGNHDDFLNDLVGFDAFEDTLRMYSPNALCGDISQVVKFHNDTTESDWICYDHFHRGAGRSKMNPHHSNFTHLREKEAHDILMTVTSHFHWEHAAYADAPFPNRTVKSLLLGSIKAFDDYAQGLGFKSYESSNPFGFIFLFDNKQQVVTDIEQAKWMCATLQEKYG